MPDREGVTACLRIGRKMTTARAAILVSRHSPREPPCPTMGGFPKPTEWTPAAHCQRRPTRRKPMASLGPSVAKPSTDKWAAPAANTATTGWMACRRGCQGRIGGTKAGPPTTPQVAVTALFIIGYTHIQWPETSSSNDCRIWSQEI
jgi:hypothetical protein